MNDKALVEIFVPAAGSRFDVYIPLDVRMSEVVRLTAGLLSELSDGKYKAAADAVLCDEESGIIYSINKEVAELGIRNGSRLMLI